MKKLNLVMSIILLFALSISFVYIGGLKEAEESTVIASFETNGGTPIDDIKIPGDIKISPVTPTREGCVFDGWYTNSDYSGEPYNFANPINTDLTFYAKWKTLAGNDILTYGTYPQARVTAPEILSVLTNITEWDVNGYANIEDKTYMKYTAVNIGKSALNGYTANSVYYFEVKPIEWKILSVVDADSYIVISSIILDATAYNSSNIPVTWETATIRTSFLANTFFNRAFTGAEQGDIYPSALVNKDNVDYFTDGGNDTTDKMYLLSIDEAKAYFNTSTNLICTGSDYSKARGLYVNTGDNFGGKSCWWLRSPGDCFVEEELNINTNNASCVDSSGYLTSMGKAVTASDYGVRPVMYVTITQEL